MTWNKYYKLELVPFTRHSSGIKRAHLSCCPWNQSARLKRKEVGDSRAFPIDAHSILSRWFSIFVQFHSIHPYTCPLRIMTKRYWKKVSLFHEKKNQVSLFQCERRAGDMVCQSTWCLTRINIEVLTSSGNVTKYVGNSNDLIANTWQLEILSNLWVSWPVGLTPYTFCCIYIGIWRFCHCR